MAKELPKQYDPHEAQKRWLQFWEERGYWHSRPDPNRKPFCIVIPPPNVTGALHMGHALNNTLQDVLIRWRRMQGQNALWMPGTDHAGIATQAVVEKRIRDEEKKTRHDIGREELVKRIWRWKDQYEKRILNQLRELGCSCDWARTRFTLDEVCARAVRHTFFQMFKDGLIYRGKRLVNWDAQLQTSVADDEVENVEQEAKFYYFKYPLADRKPDSGLDVLIATTRPETMLGDTAVAVHPEPRRELEKREQELRAALLKATEKEKKELQERLEKLAQRKQEMLPLLEKLAALAGTGTILELPLVGRKIPLIADRYADPEKGTGAVKITPAHDFNDWKVGERHPEIGEPINILHPDGRINDAGQGSFHGERFSYVGQDRFEARERVVADLERFGLIDKVETIKNKIPISDRSKTPIEPYLSDQWFVKMEVLAQRAIDAVTDGRVKFFPARYAKTYLDWLGEKRDWCISRQLWWGHQIPVWTVTCGTEKALEEIQSVFSSHPKIAERIQNGTVAYHIQLDEELETARRKGGAVYEAAKAKRPYGYLRICLLNDEQREIIDLLKPYSPERDPDVLDTWFSSALWPHSTLGWPGPALPDQPLGPKNPEWGQMHYYYPTSVLVTSRDIITLWVARMVITGLYNVKEVPFRHVYIHPKILDGFGETMSKSKGNGIDPLDIIERYGTDALRYGMVHSATETQDSRMPVANVCPHCGTLVPVKQEHMYMRTRKVTCPNCKKPFRPGGPWPAPDPDLPTAKQASDRFEMGRNFANKLWNAARFLLLNLEGYSPAALKIEELPIEDRWIISRLATTTAAVTEQLEGYHFSEAARTIYDFTWSEFCDWYVEMSKGRLRETASSAVAQRVLVGVLDSILRLVAPIMPFVAESIWQVLNEAAFERGLPTPEPATESVVVAPWPNFPEAWQDRAMEQRIARMQELVRFIREVRNFYTINPKTALDVSVRSNDGVAEDFRMLEAFIKAEGVQQLECGPNVKKPPQSAAHVVPEFEAYVSLKGLIDVEAEKKRLEKQRAEKKKYLESAKAKLANEKFLIGAPPEVVQQQRDLVAELESQIKLIEENLRDLGAS
jgi:valyl-tRNA synthetase